MTLRVSLLVRLSVGPSNVWDKSGLICIAAPAQHTPPSLLLQPCSYFYSIVSSSIHALLVCPSSRRHVLLQRYFCPTTPDLDCRVYGTRCSVLTWGGPPVLNEKCNKFVIIIKCSVQIAHELVLPSIPSTSALVVRMSLTTCPS